MQREILYRESFVLQFPKISYFHTETFRQLWIWLAEAELSLGLSSKIHPAMIEEMKAKRCDIDWAKVRSAERRLKHDVMAHIETYGEVRICCRRDP